MLHIRVRLDAWVLALPMICISGTCSYAQTAAPVSNFQMLSLIATPAITGAIGVIGAYIAIRFDARKTVNQELIKKRIAIYDNVVPRLNELLCFFLSRGSWKSLSPPLMIERKRELDQAIYIYGPLFSTIVFNQYMSFVNICFETYAGVGRDARLRANHSRLSQHWGAEWKPEWDGLFAPPAKEVRNQDVAREYNKLLTLLASEIGAKQRSAGNNSAMGRWLHRLGW